MSSTMTTWYQGLSTIQRARRGNNDFDVYFGLVRFNIGNVYSLLTRAGSSYSELMAGLGYTDVQERKALCCVQETLPFGGGSVMVWGGICGQQQQTVLSLMEILLHTVTSTRFYVLSCYRSCKTNLDSCFKRTMPFDAKD